MSKRRFIRVEWDDSWSPTGVWHKKERFEGETSTKCTSIGYLVHEDKIGVVVAAHYDGSHNFAGGMHIPKCSITKRKFIKEPK